LSSSSDELSRLQVPARAGETGFLGKTDSIRVDLGRYFGNADDVGAGAVLGRSEDERFMEGLTPTASSTLSPMSSQAGAGLRRPDCLLVLRVMVLDGEASSLAYPGVGDFDFEDTVALAWGIALEFMSAIALKRLEESLDFFRAFSLGFSRSRDSLLITSAKAFPTDVKLSECRIELRVIGLEGRDG
jgi:hypothetical protein